MSGYYFKLHFPLLHLSALLLAAALSSPVYAANVTVKFIHTDAQGTPITATDKYGNVIERYEYEPYGLQISGPVADGPGYTGHVEDTATGLTYMQQRYFDPRIGTFLSVDPVTAYSNPVGQFNRYRYVNNNPYKYMDPDGQAAIPLAVAGCAVTGPACPVGAVVGGVAGKVLTIIGVTVLVSSISGDTNGTNEPVEEGGTADSGASSDGNTNPYAGPVEDPVIVVDGDGNAIPVESGEQIGASPDGNYQEVKDREGNPTGTRLDKGGHRNQSDPKARVPHAHRPGITDETGNLHLPINPRS